jgi:hypothetical protein
LNAATGKITGTPKSAGTFSFTISVTDSAKSPSRDSQALSIVIRA